MMGTEPSTGVGSSRGIPGGTGSDGMQTNSWTMAAGRPQTPHFDASTGRLHADVATVLALVDLHVDERNGLSAGQRESLARAGVFVDGRLHPALRERLDAVARPSARLEVEVATPSSTRLHQGWVTASVRSSSTTVTMWRTCSRSRRRSCPPPSPTSPTCSHAPGSTAGAGRWTVAPVTLS